MPHRQTALEQKKVLKMMKDGGQQLTNLQQNAIVNPVRKLDVLGEST
jgi:hypothetical protein